jgi:hypothetical protein
LAEEGKGWFRAKERTLAWEEEGQPEQPGGQRLRREDTANYLSQDPLPSPHPNLRWGLSRVELCTPPAGATFGMHHRFLLLPS